MSEAINPVSKKFWFWLSICINLGFLGLFKYYNFFQQSFADFLSVFGIKASFWTLQVILPVGISFYTFHGLSYVIDIYKGRIKPERNFINYSVFVSFFPLLVAGPIERATHLLPQIQQPRQFDYAKAVNGLRQILWGLFKKMVIADNCAEYANMIFNHSAGYSGSALALGALFFTFQIYCDFSGYSDIAACREQPVCSVLTCCEILHFLIFPRHWNSGDAGTYHFLPGLGIIIYPGWQLGWHMDEDEEYLYYFPCEWFLVWCQLDFRQPGACSATYIMPSILFNTNRNNLDIVAQVRPFPNYREIWS